MTKKPDIELDRRGLVKLLRSGSYGRSVRDVFGDFVEASAIAVSNAVDLAQREAREKRYLDIMKAYPDKDRPDFQKMLACLVGELERGYDDVLGRTFMELELANKDAGQFFTPYSLCRVMAAIQIDDSLKKNIAERGFVTVNDPAAGGGATLIAYAESVREAGLNPQTQIYYYAQDIDARAVHMTYLQLSLLGLPGIVTQGDTIRMTESARWYTPRHILDGWKWRLMRREDALKQNVPEFPSPAPTPDVVLPPAAEQIALFQETSHV